MSDETINVGGVNVPKDMVEGDVFSDDSTKPESNWFEFNEVGDKIQGVLFDQPFEKEGKYGMQTIYPIQTADGKEWNVALKHTTHAVQVRQLRQAEVGDILGFMLRELVDTGKGNPAKSIEVRIRHLSK